jgi:hypothetical protein
MSEAYSTFTMRSTEDRYFQEGLALWAGHDYSDPNGSEVCWFVDCYWKAVMKKHANDLNWTYQGWSAAVQKFLDGERVLQVLAKNFVASMQCRGLRHPLFAPQNLIDKIKRKPNGKEDLLHYVQLANPPNVWEFTKFMATDIATCVHPWPVQGDVDAHLAPLQILDNWEKHKADVKAASPKPSPRNSLRATDESPMGTPCATKPGKEKLTEVEKEKAQVKEQCIKQREANPESGGTTWVYVAKKEKPKGTPQKTAQNQTKIGECLRKKPASTPTHKLTEKEVRAAVGMEIDDEVTGLDEEISEVLAQRGEEVMGPSAGPDDSPKGGRKQANKKGLTPFGENCD